MPSPISHNDVVVLIMKSEQAMGLMLDEKLTEVKIEFNSRFDSLETVINRIEAKVDTSHAEAMHERAAINKRVGKIEQLIESVRAWLAAMRVLSLARKAIITASEEFKKTLLLITAISGVFVSAVQLFHVVIPWIKAHLLR